MSKVTKATHQDSTDFEGPVDTGDPHKKRPADKKQGDMEPDTSVSKMDPGKIFDSGKVAEDVKELFKDVEGLSEDFINKAATIFEGAVSEKVSAIRAELEEQYKTDLEEAVEAQEHNLTEKLSEYMQEITEQYITDNEIAITEGFKSAVADQILESVTSIIENAGVELPDDKIDVANALSEQNQEIEAKLNESVNEVMELRKQLRKFQLDEAFNAGTQGMSDAAKDKLRSLTENIDYKDITEYASKLEVLKESISENKSEKVQDITEIDDGLKADDKQLDDRMAGYLAYSRGMSRKA